MSELKRAEEKFPKSSCFWVTSEQPKIWPNIRLILGQILGWPEPTGKFISFLKFSSALLSSLILLLHGAKI